MTTDHPLSGDLYKLTLSSKQLDLVDTARAIVKRQKAAGRRNEAIFASDLASFYGKFIADCAAPDAIARQFAMDIREGKLESEKMKAYEVLRNHATARLEISNPDYSKITT
jgi:hypothetical protein